MFVRGVGLRFFAIHMVEGLRKRNKRGQVKKIQKSTLFLAEGNLSIRRALSEKIRSDTNIGHNNRGH